MGKQNEIKAFIFDIGGVMYKEDTNYARICKKLGIDLKKFMKVWEKYRHAGSTGKITNAKYISLIAKEVKTDSERLYRVWRQIKLKEMKRMPGMESIVKKLKNRKYIVGTLTNVMGVHHEMRNEIGAYDHFHFNICSCEVGIRKPDKRIYLLLLKKLKLHPKEIVFIDDYEPCLKPARKLGLKAIRFKNPKKLIQDLKKLGVKT